MKKAVDKLFHSPWFILFLAAIPVAIGLFLYKHLDPNDYLVAVEVELEKTNKKGKPWDPGDGLPDPKLRVGTHDCPRANDTYVATCDVGERLGSAQTVVVEVWDGDTLAHDHAGRAEISLDGEPGPLVRRTQIDRLARVDVTIRRAQSFAERFGSRFAVGIGALAALLAWLLVLRRVLGEGDVPVKLGARIRVVTVVGASLALLGIAAGGLAIHDPAAPLPYLRELPCGLGATGFGLVWLHGHARGRYTTMDGLLMFLAVVAVFLPIMLFAAAIVGGLALIWILILGLAESDFDFWDFFD